MSETAAISGAAASLYQELVVERARRPHHAGELDPADGSAGGTNPLCGDTVTVSLRLDEAGHATDILHRTRGCAICAAAADLMVDGVRGKNVTAANLLFQRFDALLQQGADALDLSERETLGPLLAFSDLHDYRSRRKCATLPWSALLTAFKSAEGST